MQVLAERQWMGRLLLDPKLFYETQINPKHLGDALVRNAFDVAAELLREGTTPTLMSITERSQFIREGYVAEFSRLPDEAHILDMASIEATILAEYRQRELRALARQLPQAIEEFDDPIQWLDEHLAEITQETESDKIYAAKDVLSPLIDKIEERYKLQGELPGLSTGFASMDNMLLGLQRRRLYYVGARPSQGKSALVGQIALNVSMAGTPVGYLSLESSRYELFGRHVSNIARIDGQQLVTGWLKQSQFSDLANAAGRLYEAPMYVYDVPNLSIARVKSVARLMVRKYKIGLLVVDYLQLIRAGDSRAPRHERIGEASIALKEIARKLNIPVLCAAQLRRESEQQKRPPNIADFGDSGQIERDADTAILLHPHEDPRFVDAIFAKNRDGQKGNVALRFTGKFTRFDEVDRNKEHAVQ